LLTYLQSADANTWFKNLYERSDIIDITANATQTVVHYPKQNFNTPDSFDLQGTFKKHHILVTDNSYVAPKFDKAALVNILKSESRPFPFIGMIPFLSQLRTHGNAVARSIRARRSHHS